VLLVLADFGTNWARCAGQNAPDLLPDYEASVDSMLKRLRSLEGRSASLLAIAFTGQPA
jgi:hypothetical protein